MGDEEAEDENGYHHVTIPSDMMHVLPDNMRTHLEAIAKEGQAVLEQVQPELDRVANLSRAVTHIGTLEYTMSKLRASRFDQNSVNMEYFYELDALTTSFVVTYVRLQQGKGGAGFNRVDLPEDLRAMHDEVVRLRNKRFAHDDEDLGFIQSEMEVSFADDQFVIHPRLSVRFQIGGDPNWQKLVDAIHAIYYDRNARVIDRLSKKTGKEWTFAIQPGEA